MNTKKLKKECSDLWAKAVKKRAGGLCEISGKMGCDAHHIARRGGMVKWDLDNGIFLSREMHTGGQVSAHSTSKEGRVKFKELLIERRGVEVIERLERKAKQIKKWNLSELEDLKAQLSNYLDNGN